MGKMSHFFRISRKLLHKVNTYICMYRAIYIARERHNTNIHQNLAESYIVKLSIFRIFYIQIPSFSLDFKRYNYYESE